jgi:hypothetical protein
MNRSLLFTTLTLCLFAGTALAFEVRCYNEDGKTYNGTFNCKGTKTAVEIRAGTTSVATNADGPCELTLDNGKTLTIKEGDKLRIKGGDVSKP